MNSYLIAYGSAVLLFLLIDGLWLGVLARHFYTTQLGHLMRDTIFIWPATAFYLLYTGGLVILAIRPHQPDIPLTSVALYGASIGLLAYGTYDMTNLSTLKDWPMLMSFVDWAWGTLLSATVAVLAAIITRSLS